MNPILTYDRSLHFKERVKERFNLTEDQIDEFMNENQTWTDTRLSPLENRRNLLSDKGVLFVVDDTSKVIVTCYQSISPLIYDNVKQEFDEKLNELIWKSELTEAKTTLTEILPQLQTLVENVKAITDGDLTEDNRARLTESYEIAAIIKYTFNLLGKHSQYYKGFASDTPSAISAEPIICKPLDTIKRAPKIKPLTLSTEEYTPKVTNSTLLADKQLLRDVLTPIDKQRINNWFNAHRKQTVAAIVMRQIKAGSTKTELLSVTKSQLPLVLQNKFKNELENILRGKK